MSFTGFPVAAYDFYDDLEVDNTRSYWERHRSTWESAVRDPMAALTAELAAEFGPAKVFRPYRDVRFAKDKTPYKTHQGAFVGVAPSTGYYCELSPRGFRVGAGFYDAGGPRLAALRAAIDDPRRGGRLARLVAMLEESGWEVGGESLKTAPRGYDVDHPRIHLLRRKQLLLGRAYGFDADVHTPALVERVRGDWREVRPVVEWLQRSS